MNMALRLLLLEKQVHSVKHWDIKLRISNITWSKHKFKTVIWWWNY